MSISLMLLRLVLMGGICLLVGWLIEQRKKFVWRRIEREIKERRALALAGLPRPLRHERSDENERGEVEPGTDLDEDEVAQDQQALCVPEGPRWFFGTPRSAEETSYAHFCARQDLWGHRVSSWLGDLVTSGSGAVGHPGAVCAEGDLGTSDHGGWSDGFAGSTSHGDGGWDGGCGASDGGGTCD